jgi:mannose-1-phosphate guanylyltransferase
MRWAVVLAGGVGSRFWPLSSTERPKQLLPLAGEGTLLSDTIERLVPVVRADRLLIVTSRSLAMAICAEAAMHAVPEDNVLIEPVARSTGPALAWATAHCAARDAEATVLSVHADWAVGDADAFREAAEAALALAEAEDVLVTVGSRPTRAETGYGHIVPGGQLGGGRRISRFVEKPDEAAAQSLMFQGALWNTGMFAWTARRFRSEIQQHTPELSGALGALERGEVDEFFASVRPVSIDVGVFERTTRGAVVSGDFGWDDVGSWAALRRVRDTDAAGNVRVGATHVRETTGSVIWSEAGTIVVDGMRDVVVVQARGITLVTTYSRAASLKSLLDSLPGELAGDRGA